MKKLILSTCLVVFCLFATAQSKNQSYLDYIAQYCELALEHQRKYGIPASITLAQGILESAAGKSDLAVNAKNHFGITCTSDWEGKTYNYGGKSTGDCYRKYSKVGDSYEDHAQFYCVNAMLVCMNYLSKITKIGLMVLRLVVMLVILNIQKN